MYVLTQIRPRIRSRAVKLAREIGGAKAKRIRYSEKEPSIHG